MMHVRRHRTRLLMAVAIVTLSGIAAQPAGAAEKSYTAADVAKHGTSASCWTIVGNGVYDITPFLSQHPGGRSAVASLCGKDGTAGFNGQHGEARNPRKVLARYRIGKLKKAVTGTSTTTAQVTAITIEQVALHAAPSDCWTMINGRVYDLTAFVTQHPGGSARIISICGRDGSAAFGGQHSGSNSARRTLAAYELGTNGTAPSNGRSTGSTGSSSRDENDGDHERGRDHDRGGDGDHGRDGEDD